LIQMYVDCHYISYTECEAAMEKIKVQYDMLTKLAINSILGLLFSKNVITLAEKQTMETKPLESDRVTYLLDNVLIRSLSVNVMDKYKNFVKVLRQKGEDDNDTMMEKLANDLGMF